MVTEYFRVTTLWYIYFPVLLSTVSLLYYSIIQVENWLNEHTSNLKSDLQNDNFLQHYIDKYEKQLSETRNHLPLIFTLCVFWPAVLFLAAIIIALALAVVLSIVFTVLLTNTPLIIFYKVKHNISLKKSYTKILKNLL